MPYDTWEARADIRSLTSVGSEDDCKAWMANLMGCEATVVGKDGRTYVVGIVDRTRSANLSTLRLLLPVLMSEGSSREVSRT